MGHSNEHGHSHRSSYNAIDETTSATEQDAGQQGMHQEPPTTANPQVLRKLYTATGLCVTFLIIEAVGGYIAGSLAVLSDAAHLLADLASFAVAIMAAHMSNRPPTPQHTYGLQRVESLAALLSMASLAVVSIGLAFEAIRRLWQGPDEVDGPLMSLIALIGVLVNLTLAWVLGEHHVHLPGMDHGHDHNHGGAGSSNGSHGHDHDGHSHEHQERDHEKKASTHHDHSHEHQERNHEEKSSTHNDHSHDHNSSRSRQSSHDHSHEHSRDEEVAGEEYLQEAATLLDHEEKMPKTAYDMIADATVSAVHGLLPEPENINLHAAYLHVLGDLLQSVAVLISGLVIWCKPDCKWVDPVATLFFCAIVLYSTIGVFRSSLSVLLEETPSHLDWRLIQAQISNVEGVWGVHDLHIWSISHGQPALSVHCMFSGVDPRRALGEIYDICRKHGISHTAIQILPYNMSDSKLKRPAEKAETDASICITSGGRRTACCPSPQESFSPHSSMH